MFGIKDYMSLHSLYFFFFFFFFNIYLLPLINLYIKQPHVYGLSLYKSIKRISNLFHHLFLK